MEKLNNLHSSNKRRINNFTMKSYLYEDNDFNHLYQCNMAWFGFPMLNATFNNISVRCIVVVSFIGGGNQRTRRKPQTCRKSLTNFIT